MAQDGLRDRKKALRRQEMLSVAGALFNENGFDATTMAEIADAARVTPPTVFNYFGSKENILTALLLEGAAAERRQHWARPKQTGCHFAVILGDMLCDISVNTMRIAGKRVWRYAESANIRKAASEFQQLFSTSDQELLKLITGYLAAYDLVLRNGDTPDTEFLGQVIYDRWTARYFDYIKDDAMPMDDHLTGLRTDARALVALLFDDAFAQSSPLKQAAFAQ